MTFRSCSLCRIASNTIGSKRMNGSVHASDTINVYMHVGFITYSITFIHYTNVCTLSCTRCVFRLSIYSLPRPGVNMRCRCQDGGNVYVAILMCTCVCHGRVWTGHLRLSRVPDTGRPARYRVRGPPRRSPGTAALVRARRRAGDGGGPARCRAGV